MIQAVQRFFTGMRFPRFQQRGKPSPLSVSDMNRLVQAVEILYNVKIVPSDRNKVTISDTNTIIEFKPGTGTTIVEPGDTTGLVFRGEYNPASSYNEDDCVYTLKDGNRLFWICTSATLSGPSWPDSGTSWKCVARPATTVIGLYSSSTEYYPSQICYTEPAGEMQRFTFYCTSTNGPSAGVHAPEFPSENSYWKCIGQVFLPDIEIRETPICIGGVEKYVKVLRGAPYDTPEETWP